MTSNHEPLPTRDADSTPPRSSRPALLHRAVTRPAGLVALTGLAAGAGFAAVTGISSASISAASPATTSSTSTASTSTSATSTAAPSSSAPTAPGAGMRRGPGGMGGSGFGRGGFGHGQFGGREGTVTKISGSVLTLRTANGTETVKTTSTTKYTKERVAISLSAIKVGDIVGVSAPRPSTPAATPGTGTVTATAIHVVLPRLSGRVSAVGAGQYTIVGREGQLLTISVNSSTTYYNVALKAPSANGPRGNAATKTTSAAVKVGTRIVAEGAQDSLTHLSADTVTVVPTPTGGGAGGHHWGSR